MRCIFAAALIALGLPAVASAAQPISAGEFLARAEPLMKRSKVALMFSGEARALMRTVGDAAQHNRARLDAARAAGKPVTTCLPPKGKASVSATELLAYLRGLPPAQRAQSFETAFAGFMQRKYPCG